VSVVAVNCVKSARALMRRFRILRGWRVSSEHQMYTNCCSLDVRRKRMAIGKWDLSAGAVPVDYELHEVLHAALRSLCEMDRRKRKEMREVEEHLVQDICAVAKWLSAKEVHG